MQVKIFHPLGKDRGRYIQCGHLFVEGATGIFVTGISRNHRRVSRITDVNGVLQTYRVFGRKSVKLNRLPRGSRRRTGVWNGQNVAEMVAQ